MALIGKTNEEKMWNYFMQKDKIGNPYGVAGLMGNAKKESNFNPKNMQNSYEAKLGFTDETYVAAVDNNTYHGFQTDRCGFGIFQHTSSGRKTNMWIRSKETGKSIGDLEFQFDFAMWEFKNGYKAVWNKLKTATSVKEASDYVCKKYERPADQSTKGLKRRSDAAEEIFEKFAKETPQEEEKVETAPVVIPAGNSPLVDYILLSPNCTKPRKKKIIKITIHHMAGDLSVEVCGQVFQNPKKKGSSNYGIGTDGRVGLYVEECNRAWTSGSSSNDNQAVTIEVANDVIGGDWHVSDTALAKTIELCEDICKRNDIEKLNFTGNKKGNLTMHRYFQATTCPGNYLASKFPYIADEVNKRLGSYVPSSTPPLKVESDKKAIQTYLNTYYGDAIKEELGDLLVVDGSIGSKSRKAIVIAIQTELNKLGADLEVDGGFGSRTTAAYNKYVGTLKRGNKDNIFITLWQCALVGLNYNPNGIDGSFGNGCKSATTEFQKKNKLTATGALNANTFKKAFQ